MTKKVNYAQLNQELEEVLASLQAGDIDIDDAIRAYARGRDIIKQLESYLKSAKNTIDKITL